MTTPGRAAPRTEAADWTEDEEGRSNSSELFRRMVGELARLMRGSAAQLLTGDTQGVARLILAQLAHVHGFGPVTGEAAVAPALDRNSRAVTYAELERALRKSLDAAMVFAAYPAGDPYGPWARRLWDQFPVARLSQVAALDVERLRTTLWGMKWDADADRFAKKIAAEYERLSHD